MTDPSHRRGSRTSMRPAPSGARWGDQGSTADDDTAMDSIPSARVVGEDFLYHLYRGSELLQDNCVTEAKEELERALAVQPRDVEGQGLLGVVYFRLGLYPRAIEIFEDLLRSFPNEIAPRMNLALSYLKTGQQHRAREQLEGVVLRAPEHRRAWGYLGLVLERLGELASAEAAFERAGQQAMARRMRHRLDGTIPPSESADAMNAAAAAVAEIDLDAQPFLPAETTEVAAGALQQTVGRWRAHEPGRPPSLAPRSPTPPRGVSTPPPPVQLPVDPPVPPSIGLPPVGSLPPMPGTTPRQLVERILLVEPPGGLAQQGDHTVIVRVRGTLVVRGSAVRALVPDRESFHVAPVHRRVRGHALDEVLGGAHGALDELSGSGRIVLNAASRTRRLVPIRLVEGELFYVREALLVAFDGTLRHESGRLPLADGGSQPVVQLSGVGAAVIDVGGELHAVPVAHAASIAVVADDVVGWTGRLFPRVVEPVHAPAGARGLIGFTGDGEVLVTLGASGWSVPSGDGAR